MTTLDEALARIEEFDRLGIAALVTGTNPIVAAARNWQTLTKPDKAPMRIFGSVDQMKQARKQLGSPAALDEALVATGIDALFWLLDGGSVEIEGRRFTLVDALTDTAEEEK